MAQRKHRNTRRRKSAYRPLPSLHPVDPVYESVGLGLLFVATLTLFALSTGRTVLLEDDGLFITAAYTLGVVHPPGYPLYTLLGWLYTHIPFGSIAWRVHLLSGTFGALTCVCVAWLVLRRTGSRLSAWLAGAMLAVSEHFWSQSIIADVYTFNAALLFSTLVLGQEAVVRRSNRLWIAAAVCYGLGLANHWILLVLGSPILLAWGWAGRQQLISRLYFLVPIALATAGLLYGWLVYRSNANPAISFSGPIQSLSELIAYIRRDAFANADSQVTAGLIDKVYYAGNTLWQLFIQFTPLGFLVALLGVLHQYRQGWRLGLYAELAAVLGSVVVLIVFLGFEYNPFVATIFRPYLVAIYAVLAIWFGYGLAVLYSRLEAWPRMNAGLTLSACLLVLGLLGWNGSINWRANETFARDYARALLDALSPNAILVPTGDGYLFPLAYLSMVQGYRADVRILHVNGLIFGDRVVRPDSANSLKIAQWLDFIRLNSRPLYYQSFGGLIEKSVSGKTHFGYVFRANPNSPIGATDVQENDAGREFFLKMVSQPDSKDIWINHHRNKFLSSYGTYLGHIMAIGSPTMQSYIDELLPLARNSYWTLIGIISTLLTLPTNDSEFIALAKDYLEHAQKLDAGYKEKADQALIVYFDGLLSQKEGKLLEARNLFARSVEINPAEDNPARHLLKQLKGPLPE